MVLERLKHTPATPEVDPPRRKAILSPQSQMLSKRLMRYVPSPKMCNNRYSMCLRSGSRVHKVIKRLNGKDIAQKKKVKARMPNKSILKVTRVDFNTEDDRPLTFFTKKGKNLRSYSRKTEAEQAKKDEQNNTSGHGKEKLFIKKIFCVGIIVKGLF